MENKQGSWAGQGRTGNGSTISLGPPAKTLLLHTNTTMTDFLLDQTIIRYAYLCIYTYICVLLYYVRQKHNPIRLS